MIEAGGLDPYQGLAWSERSDFLEFKINDLCPPARRARATRRVTGNPVDNYITSVWRRWGLPIHLPIHSIE